MHPAQAQAILMMIDSLSQQLGTLRQTVAGAMEPMQGSPQWQAAQRQQQMMRQRMAEAQRYATPEEEQMLDQAYQPAPDYPGQAQGYPPPQPQYAPPPPAHWQQPPMPPQQGNWGMQPQPQPNPGQGFGQFQDRRPPPASPPPPPYVASPSENAAMRLFQQASQEMASVGFSDQQ